jgi:hypothetical protein
VVVAALFLLGASGVAAGTAFSADEGPARISGAQCRPGGSLPTRNQGALALGREIYGVGQDIDLIDEAIGEAAVHGIGSEVLIDLVEWLIPPPLRAFLAAQHVKKVGDLVVLKQTLIKRRAELESELRRTYPALATRVIAYFTSTDWPPQNIALGFTGYEYVDGTVRYGWGTGAVVITSNDRSPVRSASFGRTSGDVAHKGPWKCGAQVTLWARPDKGIHFDHWSSHEHLCQGSDPKCTTRLVPNSSNSSHDIHAYFAITTYQLSVTNTNQQGGILQGGQNTLSCGDLGGLSGNHCSARVPAQRSATDLQEVDAETNDAQWSIASIGPCDRVDFNTTSDGRRIQARCYVAMTSDRSVTVSWARVGA